MMDKKSKTLYILFISIVNGLMFTLLGNLLGSGYIDWGRFPLTLLVGVAIGFCVGNFIPAADWGVALAFKLKAKPNSFLFRLIITMVIVLVMVLFMGFAMPLFTITILDGAPVQVALQTSLNMLPRLYLIAVVVVMIVGKPLQALARKITKSDVAKN